MIEASQAYTASNRYRALSSRFMEEVTQPEDLNRAYQRVRANRGASGVDGMTIGKFKGWLRPIRRNFARIATRRNVPTYPFLG